ncbi:hypothetical protein PoB_004819300 [Plakobranchus ocellatus]|uniref:Uncharacterized protein n=1 Tax=Plakobranchus ocellatus TaxID=259542 RepID=A0AAV4BS72_9GAST|nr:hypothetical protein PoB_004819300 [Plakobranchus ocellatus]
MKAQSSGLKSGVVLTENRWCGGKTGSIKRNLYRANEPHLFAFSVPPISLLLISGFLVLARLNGGVGQEPATEGRKFMQIAWRLN